LGQIRRDEQVSLYITGQLNMARTSSATARGYGDSAAGSERTDSSQQTAPVGPTNGSGPIPYAEFFVDVQQMRL
jgi:hypothetical protein